VDYQLAIPPLGLAQVRDHLKSIKHPLLKCVPSPVSCRTSFFRLAGFSFSGSDAELFDNKDCPAWSQDSRFRSQPVSVNYRLTTRSLKHQDQTLAASIVTVDNVICEVSSIGPFKALCFNRRNKQRGHKQKKGEANQQSHLQ